MSADMPKCTGSGSEEIVIGVTAEADDTVIADEAAELEVAALEDDAIVSGDVEEDSSVEDAIVDVHNVELGHHVVRLITSG
jgi:hypothetical protein